MSGETTTIQLKHPVKHGEDEITELTVRRMKGKDLRGIVDIKTMDSQLKIIGRVTGQPDSVINQMDIADIEAVGDAMGNFVEDSR